MADTKNELKKLAAEIFGDKNKAEIWLNIPIKALNDKAPLTKLEYVEGIEEVRVILRKIEDGGFT